MNQYPDQSSLLLAQLAIDGSLNLSLDLVPFSPKKIYSPSRLSIRSSNNFLPLQELLLLSPLPYKRSKTRLADRLEAADEPAEGRGVAGAQCKRCKRKEGQAGLLGCASPRSNRRSRRRTEVEVREEHDLGLTEEAVRQKRKHDRRSRKERLSLVPLVNTSSSLSLSTSHLTLCSRSICRCSSASQIATNLAPTSTTRRRPPPSATPVTTTELPREREEVKGEGRERER